MKNIQSNKFKPQDLFDDTPDNEDKIYMAEYDLNEERRKKQEQA